MSDTPTTGETIDNLNHIIGFLLGLTAGQTGQALAKTNVEIATFVTLRNRLQEGVGDGNP